MALTLVLSSSRKWRGTHNLLVLESQSRPQLHVSVAESLSSTRSDYKGLLLSRHLQEVGMMLPWPYGGGGCGVPGSVWLCGDRSHLGWSGPWTLVSDLMRVSWAQLASRALSGHMLQMVLALYFCSQISAFCGSFLLTWASTDPLVLFASHQGIWEKTLESPLDWKEIKPVNPKGNQSWIFIGRTDAEAEALILWLPDVKSWFFGKDLDVGKDRGQEKKGATEDEMVGWHHWLYGHEFE